MTRHALATLLSFTLLFSLSACDSNGSSNGNGDGNGNGGNGLGTYSATVTGNVSRELDGSAVAAGTSQQSGWGLALGGTTGDFVTILAPTGNRPPTGTYQVLPYEESDNEIDPDKFVASVTLGGTNVYFSTGGTFEVTTSTSTQVAGTFSFTAASPQEDVVTVNGIYNATNVGN